MQIRMPMPVDPPTIQRTTLRGFTLVELLVVIGIIALLIGILMPALSKARDQARSTQCMSNQRQIFTCMMMFVNEHKGLPPGSDSKDNSGNQLTPPTAPQGLGVGQLISASQALADSAL